MKGSLWVPSPFDKPDIIEKTVAPLVRHWEGSVVSVSRKPSAIGFSSSLWTVAVSFPGPRPQRDLAIQFKTKDNVFTAHLKWQFEEKRCGLSLWVLASAFWWGKIPEKLHQFLHEEVTLPAEGSKDAPTVAPAPVLANIVATTAAPFTIFSPPVSAMVVALPAVVQTAALPSPHSETSPTSVVVPPPAVLPVPNMAPPKASAPSLPPTGASLAAEPVFSSGSCGRTSALS